MKRRGPNTLTAANGGKRRSKIDPAVLGQVRFPLIVGLVLGALPAEAAEARSRLDPTAPFETAIADAERSLRSQEPQAAESRYRSALFEAWLLLGTLERIDGRLVPARDAFRSASTSAVDDRRALQALAFVDLQRGEADEALRTLRALATREKKDVATRRLLAQALAARGEDAEAVRELEVARRLDPRDPELAFALATEYLRVGQPERAAPLFAEVLTARASPQTHVLVGRTYRDTGHFEQARAELRKALRQDARVPRAHYYLGTVALQEKRRAGVEEAIAEFQAELEVSPADPLASLELGMALVESRRPAEALPALEVAARAGPPSARIFYYLGRAQLGADRAAEGVASLEKALAMAREQGADSKAMRAIHLQLGEALRKVGRAQEAAEHFAELQRASEKNTEDEREQMARYLADVGGADAPSRATVPLLETSPLAALAPEERQELRRAARVALARAYLNLGVLQAQGERFARAAELIEQAAAVDPDFAGVQSALGVAYFNARQFDKATAPLERALRGAPGDAGLSACSRWPGSTARSTTRRRSSSATTRSAPRTPRCSSRTASPS